MIKRVKNIISKFFPDSFTGRLSIVIIILWVFMAIFSPFIANNKPILAKSINGWSMPILSAGDVKENFEYSFKINPIIPYKYDDLDLKNSFKPPLTSGLNGIHLLGTDLVGRDIAAGMVNGARVAFIIASIAIILSFVFGIFIGLTIGFYGDNGIKRNLLQQISIVLIIIFSMYYLIHIVQDGFTIYTIIPLLILGIIGYILDVLFGKISIKKYGLPIDLIVQRLFEIQESVPGLFIILAFVAIVVKISLFTIPLILAFLHWMTFAHHARAEALHIRGEEYVQSAKASGMSDLRLLWKHVLPNALPHLLVVVAFSFSGVILIESTLSFLGIGLPLEEISWGKILAEARKSPKSWWLAVFPGLAIFLVLYSFNTLGDILSTYQRNQK